MKANNVVVSGLIALGTLACLLGSGAPSRAQSGSGLPPPTYDFDTTTPGIQPPQSPLIAGHDYRSVRTYQVTIPVLVSLADLQAILPPGFTAIATPVGSRTATLSLAFFVDQRFDRITANGTATYGPVSALLVSTTVLNTNVAPARQELVFPCFEASGEINALNASFGPGAARFADVHVQMEQQGTAMRFAFDIADSANGFRISAEAVGPTAMNARSVSDPVGLAFRTFNGLSPNQAFRAASQSDTATIPTAAAGGKVKAPFQRLQFPAGPVTVVGLGANITFSRNVEFFVKYE